MSTWKVTEADILSRLEVGMVWAELCRKAARSTNTRQTRAIFCLATFCGLRNSEICGLRLRDAKLDIPRPVLDVPVGVAKGLRPRQVPLWRLPTALGCLAAWKAERYGQGAGAMDRLVCAQSHSAQGRPLDRRNARARFISACAVLGPERQAMLTIHNGRHTCASHLLAAGWPLPAVRDLLGHANIWTTSLYSHVVVDDLTPPDPFAFAAGGGTPPSPWPPLRWRRLWYERAQGGCLARAGVDSVDADRTLNSLCPARFCQRQQCQPG